MSEIKLLGRKTDNWLINPYEMPEGFKFSLGRFQAAEYDHLLCRAFEQDGLAWDASPNLVGVPIVRASNGVLAAACSVVQPAFLHQVAVDPDYQKLGLGAAFIRQVAHIFELPYLLAQVDEMTTVHGLRFWKKQGFREVGT